MVSVATPGRTVRRGHVFWVDFGPTRGSEQSGKRPALVVQNDVGNKFSPNTIVAALTTRVAEKAYPTEVRLPDEVFGRPSVILCAQVLTISQERLLGDAVTALDAATMDRVDAALRLSLGL